MPDLQQIRDIILESQEVAIVSHISPDGDAIGSQIALALGLDQLGIKTMLLNHDPVPGSLCFLDSWQRIQTFEQVGKLPSVVIFVDCATFDRSGLAVDDIHNKAKNVLINIDHHISNTKFADLNWVEPKAAATAELIYDLLGLLQVQIDEKMATALYTAISTDTGSFLYENTTPTTHQVVADLIVKGAQVSELRTKYYENVSMSKMKLLRHSLNNLNFAFDNSLVWITLNDEIYQKFAASDGDGEGLAGYLKSLAGVEVAIVFRETDLKKIKVSFRSKSWFDVNKLAALFSGGGHPRAAGCIFEGNLDDAVKKITNAVIASMAQGGSK